MEPQTIPDHSHTEHGDCESFAQRELLLGIEILQGDTFGLTSPVRLSKAVAVSQCTQYV